MSTQPTADVPSNENRKRKHESGTGEDKKKKRSFHHRNQRPARSDVLSDGQRGFLVTCGDERRAVTECYRLFEEYAAKLQLGQPSSSSGKDSVSAESDSENDSDSEDVDISEKIIQEMNEAAKEAEKTGADKKKQPLFHQMKIGVHNCLFIRTTIDDPVEFVHRILSDVKASGRQRCRFINRILPVETTCKIQQDAVQKAMGELITKHFKDTGKTFSVEYKSRHQKEFTKTIIIDMATEMIHAVSPLSKANLGNPELAVIVEMFQNTCCLSIGRDYGRLSRYNIQQVVAKKDDADSKPKEAGVVAVAKSTDDNGATTTEAEEQKEPVVEDVIVASE